MTLTRGARLGPYEILALIGAGGMGEVYKARDTRLDRQVAIKLLHADMADRADRRARFESEARAISSLNDPHICTLFDVGDQNGRAFLVLEYLEGETLDDRLTRGPLNPRDVLRYGVEIATALDHAHRERVVHRDVKPSNVMLTASGVKLLDFGLAKASPLRPLAASTLTMGPRTLTAEGTLVGTFHYMAPEQLEGKPCDARTDVFALGTVLYEMATGRKPFDGESQASLIASILTKEPPAVSSVREGTNPDSPLFALDHLVDRCLAKDPDRRWQTARDVALELQWIAGHVDAPHARARRPLQAVLPWALALAAMAIALTVAVWPRREAPLATTRFIISPPQGTTIGVAENRTRIALSPDGRRLAFVGFTAGHQQLWIRSLDALAAVPVAGTEGAVSPFWSPDSRFVGFFSPADGEVRKVEAAGGPVQTVCAAQVDGALAWGADGTILFTEFPGGGIHKVAAEGGPHTRVTTVDAAKRELNHYWPEFLPDGRHFLFMATGLDENGLRATPGVYVASLDGRPASLLTRMHSRMTFVAPGFLLFVQEGALLAQRFDPAALKLSGEPVPIAEGLGYFRTLGNGGFSVSRNGVLAFQGSTDPLSLHWVDRSGTATSTGWTAQNFGSVRVSPDGSHIAADVVDERIGTSDIWIYDISRGAPVRVTTELTSESFPMWSPDGKDLLFRWERGGSPNLYTRTIGAGPDNLVIADPSPLSPEDWSRDGAWIAYVKNTRQTGRDLYLKPLQGKQPPQPFAATRFDEAAARFSPDSQWLAFVSNESGSYEVYVARAFQGRDKQRISIGGGTSPRWRRDGLELFYVAADGRSIMKVPITPAPSFRAGLPSPLFSIGDTPIARERTRNAIYDVTPDGQRFIVARPAGESSSSRITVVLNWTSALTGR